MYLGDHRLLLDDDLRVAGNPGTERSGQGKGLVEGVGVERLSPSEYCRHRLDACTDYVVVGILYV